MNWFKKISRHEFIEAKQIGFDFDDLDDCRCEELEKQLTELREFVLEVVNVIIADGSDGAYIQAKAEALLEKHQLTKEER